MGGLLARVDTELGENLADVPLDGVEAEAQRVADFGVGAAFCYEREDFALTVAEVLDGAVRVHGRRLACVRGAVTTLWAILRDVVQRRYPAVGLRLSAGGPGAES